MLSFKGFKVDRPEQTASKKRAAVNNEITKSEVHMILDMGMQRIEFDIEAGPPAEGFFFYKYGVSDVDVVRVTLEERVFKLERDEAAFMEHMKQINTKVGTSVNSFLMQRSGALHEDNFNNMVKKKKTLKQTRPFPSVDIEVAKFLGADSVIVGTDIPFKVQVDTDVTIVGAARVTANRFTEMPRGTVEVSIIGASRFGVDENVAFEKLAFKAYKQASKIQGDSIVYHA